MESKLVLHTKTRHINVYAHPENVTHLTKEKMGTLNLQGGTAAYVKQFIDEHNQDESAHPYIQENISELEGMLDGKQDTISDLETIRSGAALGATSVQPGDLATVATTGDYDDLTNKPTIGNATLTIQKNGTSAGTFTANATSDSTINITVPTTAADVDALPDTTKYGASLEMSVNSSTFVVTTTLKDQDGNTLGTAQTIDLPLESVVVGGSYDSANKKVVLTLQNGSTIEFSVADLVAGLQSEITSSNKLSADLVDDTSTTNKFVTTSEKSTWNGKQDAISDLATIRSGAALGATSVQPADIEDVWTQTNLIAGTNISIDEVQQEGGFDEHTKGVWHLENNTDNAVTDSSWALGSSFITEYSDSIYKFGSYSGRRVQNSGTLVNVFATKITNTASNDFTIDLWVRSGISSASSNASAILKLTNTTDTYKTAQVEIFKDKIVTLSSQQVTVDPATWHHIAFERYNSNMYTYIDGVVKETSAIQYDINYFAEQHNYSPAAYFDEIRLSNIARYQGQSFTPPTEPYSASDAPTKYQINNTLQITGAASSIVTNDLTASKALVSDSSGKVAASSVTDTELGYLSGVTSAVQTQINAKADDSGVVHTTGDESIAGTKTFTTKVVSPIVETGSAAANYFQCQKFRGEGNANTYYHAIDFGYANHDQVDFYEYGGKWVFHKHTGSAQSSGDTVVGQILSTGWNGPVVGNVTGNVTGNLTGTASKATADADGNTISSTYAKKTDIMTGATSSAAGTSGLVPAPAAGDETKFLRGDGTWVGSTAAAVWGSLTGTLSDQTDLQNALNAKQGTLTAGVGTDITSNTISVIGVKDQNNSSNAIKRWTGTKAQYDAIATKDANTLYTVTDDMNMTDALLQAIYPVGSIYITTNSSCPLSTLISGSSWVLVSSGRVLQGADNDHAAGTTIEAGLPNITGDTGVNQGGSTGAATGAFAIGKSHLSILGRTDTTDTNSIDFDASRSSSIYGNSNTVQPPAYVVNIFRRTA